MSHVGIRVDPSDVVRVHRCIVRRERLNFLQVSGGEETRTDDQTEKGEVRGNVRFEFQIRLLALEDSRGESSKTRVDGEGLLTIEPIFDVGEKR